MSLNTSVPAHSPRIIHAPTGTTLHCKNWQIEAAYRMIQNNLDPDVAEDPDHLVVYGGIGKAARNWPCFESILQTLINLEADETLLVQSGKPVAVLKTHTNAPRVLIANSNLVPKWATWEHFQELDRKGLMMYGQMTAGSWIYIGSQGIVQGTYETFVELGRQHYGNDWTNRWILTAGLGGMGGAQPLAATMAGAHCIAIECQESRIDFRLKTRYLDYKATSIQEALNLLEEATKPISIGLLGNAAELVPEFLAIAKRGGPTPSAVTDQTSSHDLYNGYLPIGWTCQEWFDHRSGNPSARKHLAYEAGMSCATHVRAMLGFHAMGIPTIDYGNNLRQAAFDNGIQDAFSYPGFVPACIRPLFCEGKGPFRWVALSGDPEDIYRTDEKIKELFPERKNVHRWLDQAKEKIAFQGLPARICWLGLGERYVAGLAFNDMVRNGELKAPIVIGRDHLDTGSVASPNRETEQMLDGSDAVSDWPILNALLATAGGATWVSFHHGGGVGMGYSQHAGQVIVADGTEEAAIRLKTVLWNDPALGVVRHADAGYELAQQTAASNHIHIPVVAS